MARNGMSVACLVRSHRLANDPHLTDDHVSSCLRCQVEAVRYRTLVRSLGALREDLITAPPELASVVKSGLGEETLVPKKAPGIEAAVAAASLAAVVLAFWRRTLSA